MLKIEAKFQLTDRVVTKLTFLISLKVSALALTSESIVLVLALNT